MSSATQSRPSAQDKPKNAIVAGLDIGSNTVRLLLAEVGPQALRPLLRLQGITRLGGGFDPQRGLSVAAVGRTVRCLEAMRAELGAELPDHVGLATSAVRRAANRQDFIDRIRQATGFEIEVIHGRLEAELTARGVRSSLELDSAFWLVDVGGGSTELGWWSGQGGEAASVELGCISLLHAELHSDPPTHDQLAAAQLRADRALADLRNSLKRVGAAPTRLVAVAGTPTTCAALKLGLRKYDVNAVHGSELNAAELDQLLDLLAALPVGRRSSLAGMERGREDLIVPGILVLRAALRAVGLERITVSDAGLLEGAALLAADRFRGPAERRVRPGGKLTVLGPFG